jgi:hypothetical protein
MVDNMRFTTYKAFPDKQIEKEYVGWDDPDANYDFAIQWLVLADGQWYVVFESGCSCYGPGDDPSIEEGPFDTLAKVREYVEAEYASNETTKRYYRNQRDDLLAAIEVAASETP